MLLFLALWALVPCLVLVTLYFLSSVGGKSGGNKKNDGVKVSPWGPTRAGLRRRFCQRAWLSGLGQTWPLLQPAGPRPRDLGFGAHLLARTGGSRRGRGRGS